METAFQKDIQDYYSWWRRMNALYHDWAEEHGVSEYTVYVLHTLLEKQGCTQKQICEEWILSKQTVNSILKGLGQKGYLKSVPSVADGRKKILSLTDEGERYARKMIGELSVLEGKVMERMGERRRKQMNQSANLFCDLFEEERRNHR